MPIPDLTEYGVMGVIVLIILAFLWYFSKISSDQLKALEHQLTLSNQARENKTKAFLEVTEKKDVYIKDLVAQTTLLVTNHLHESKEQQQKLIESFEEWNKNMTRFTDASIKLLDKIKVLEKIKKK